jgi:hypothetical protein
MTDLNLSGNGLTGSLPGEIGNLGALVTLDIAVNGFTDALPSELGSLSVLETLNISNNQFEGEIPLSFDNLTAVTYFNTTNNNLCLPDDPDVLAWYAGIPDKPGLLGACVTPTPTITPTITKAPNTLTPTPIPLPTTTPTATSTPTITLTPTILGPYQTLTVMAHEDTLTATANWFRTPSPVVTATRYYILVSQTLLPGGVDPQNPQNPGEGENDFPIPGEDDGSGISGLWWLLLIIPIGMIGVGVFLELRGRRLRGSDSGSPSPSTSSSTTSDDDDEGFQTFLD